MSGKGGKEDLTGKVISEKRPGGSKVQARWVLEREAFLRDI